MDWRLKLSVFISLVILFAMAIFNIHTKTMYVQIHSVEVKYKKELADLIQDNDDKEDLLNSFPTTPELLDKATNLGMKHPTKDQVMYYTLKDNTRITQYKPIPKE